MNAAMNNEDDDVYEEDDYEPSDATLLFADEVNREFKKAFPLKAETEKKRQQEIFRRHAPPMARKLNFDQTLSPEMTPSGRMSRLIELKLKNSEKENDRLKTQLKGVQQEIERARQMTVSKDQKLTEQMEELDRCREQIRDLQEQKAVLLEENNSTIRECNDSVDIWTAFGKKYYIWHAIASAQLEAVKLYVDANGSFEDEEEVARLNSIARQMFMATQQIDFDDDFAKEFGNGSLLAYDGVEFNTRTPEAAREAARADVSSANFTLPQSNQTVLDETNTTLAEDRTMMTDGRPASRLLIDYEKDEKIQRLLLENSVLKDRLNVSIGRAEKSMLMEEKNRNLESEKDFLQKQLDSSFTEIQSLRIGQQRELFKVDESAEIDSSAKQLKLIDRITQLITQNNQLEKDFAAATSRMTQMVRSSADCERRNERLEDAFANERERSQMLEAEKAELVTSLKASSTQIRELEEKLGQMHTELQEALNKTVTVAPSQPPQAAAPTDAGNTTQIFHMASNPLQAAYAEFQEAESRKRKMVDAPEGDTTAKHFREEQIADLEERIDICEREKKVLEDSYNLHKELSSKFRQVCLALTGLQIKLKDADEGIITVQSEYEAGSERQFVFKYFYGTSRVDMLDVNSESTTEMLRKWEPLMKKYIGERNSIPAFLAAMTLQLEKERDFDATMLERTHTFSVLHED
ncbi:unnamed protein product [Caenorhabditis sp. 36 PRJEB53466]|nr:unnamed protein product [Caenorhabditis sp. 36 PRJEB53466]